MIIAAYAGTGKSTFARTIQGAIDILSMPYSWILPIDTEISPRGAEYEKGAMYHLRNPLFPYNFIAEILKA